MRVQALGATGKIKRAFFHNTFVSRGCCSLALQHNDAGTLVFDSSGGLDISPGSTALLFL